MREELLVYSRRLAVALRGVRETSQPLGDKLPDSFLWPLAVILASWDLSRQDKNKAALSRILGPGGVPPMWVYLDFYSAQLDPVSESLSKNQSPRDLTNSLREAINKIGMRTLGEVLKSRQFRSAAKFINSQIPPEVSRITVNSTSAPETKVMASTEDPELINLALQYLIFLGYSTTEASNYVAGKKV